MLLNGGFYDGNAPMCHWIKNIVPFHILRIVLVHILRRRYIILKEDVIYGFILFI